MSLWLVDSILQLQYCSLHPWRPLGDIRLRFSKEGRGKGWVEWRCNLGVDLNSGLTTFKWAMLGSYAFVMTLVSAVGLSSKESPVVGVGKARDRLGRSRVRMKDDKNSHKKRGERGLWRAHGQAAVTRS